MCIDVEQVETRNRKLIRTVESLEKKLLDLQAKVTNLEATCTEQKRLIDALTLDDFR